MFPIGLLKKKYFLTALIIVIFMVNGLWGALFSLRPHVHRDLSALEIQTESGHAYQVALPNLNWIYSFKGDDSVNAYRSTLVLLENGKELGPSHAFHEVIRSEGNGAYSHWGKTLYFSASDNSNPRTNQKKYQVHVRAGLRFTITGSFLLVNALILFILLVFVLRGGMISSEALAGMAGALCTIVLFFLNIIPVTHWLGRSFYLGLGVILFLTAFFLLFLDLRTPQKFSSFILVIRRVEIGLVMLLFLFLSGESLCRAFPIADTLAVNPGCRFFWPDWYRYALNEYGYRERNIPKKEESVYRILIYGDSYTEGAGVSRDELTGIQLEKILNKKLTEVGTDMKVEAYNLGHCGANTRQEISWILADYEKLKPDLVVLNYVLNDAEDSIPTLVSTESKLSRFMAAHLTGDHGSYFYYRWLRMSPRFFPSVNSEANSGRNYIEVIHDDDQPGWMAAQKAFQDLSSFLETRETDALAVVLPLFTPNVTPEMGEVMAKVTQAMVDKNLESYNLLNYFMESSNNNLLKLAYSRGDSHPNAQGHLQLAYFLSELILHRKSFRKKAFLSE